MLKLKLQFFGKDPAAGKDWGQEEEGVTEDEMVRWHHRFNGHEFRANFGRWWRTGRPGLLQFMGSQSWKRLSDYCINWCSTAIQWLLKEFLVCSNKPQSCNLNKKRCGQESWKQQVLEPLLWIKTVVIRLHKFAGQKGREETFNLLTNRIK